MEFVRGVSNNATLGEYHEVIKDDLLKTVENEEDFRDRIKETELKFVFYLVSSKYKNFIKFLNDSSKLSEIAANPSVVLSVRVKTASELKYDADENASVSIYIVESEYIQVC